MKRTKFLILAVVLSSGIAVAQSQPQQGGAQAGASASSSTSASASRASGVQAGNSSSGTVSTEPDGKTLGSTAASTSLAAGSSANARNSGAQVASDAVDSTAASADTPRGGASAFGDSTANSTMSATLVHPVDAKKNKPGDPVRARTIHASQSPDGTPLPKGTELVGHVTQAQARTKNQSQSDLGIVFDKALLKNGQQVPINGTIQAVAAAQNSTSAADSFGDAGLDGGSMAAGGLAAGGSSGPGRAGFVGGGAPGAGGALSGVGRSLGTATAPVSNIGSSARGEVATTAGAVRSSATVAPTTARGVTGGLNAAGELTPNSQGVFNMQGLNLTTAATSANSLKGAAGVSLLTSGNRNVHLDSGTQLLVSASNAAQLQASK